MATNQLTTKKNELREQLSGDAFKQAIAEVLPKHLTADRMARTAIAALTRTPKLANCTPASFFGCMMQLSQWGLEPDGRRAHLIPYKDTCTLIIDYKGLVELAYRTGMVRRLHADVIHAGDLFEYDRGEVKRHVPWFLRTDKAKPDTKGEVIAAYCECELSDGVCKSELMEVAEVKAIQKRSRSGNSGPWVTDFNEMAKKTAFRRLSKWLPLSSELRDATEKDDDQFATQSEAEPVELADFQAMFSEEQNPLEAEEKENG